MEETLVPPFTDAELEELALAAGPEEHLDGSATPLRGSVPDHGGALPGWYMPPVAQVIQSRPRRIVALVVVGAFLLINALGLCATYGFLEIA